MTTDGSHTTDRIRERSGRLAARILRYLRSPAPAGMVALAITVGAGAGYGAVLFRWLISTAHYIYFDGLGSLLGWLGPYRVILLPAAGAWW